MSPRAAIRPTYVEVDLAALRHNTQLVSERARVPIYAVIKADAYGHGVLPVARALASLDCVSGFAVNLVEEALALRDADFQQAILVMGPALAGAYDAVVARALTPMVSTHTDLEQLARAAAERDRLIDVHVMVDTGMGRLGFSPADVPSVLDRCQSSSHLTLGGVCTHFACADTDDPDDPTSKTRVQMTAFRTLCDGLRDRGARDGVRLHVANSATVMRFSGRGLNVGGDVARVGLALYGNGAGTSTAGTSTAGGAVERRRLRQVMRLVTHIVQVRTVAQGETVSYGALWRAPRTTRVAVLPIGYADGVPRRLTGRADVLIDGTRCHVIGAITMGITMVDVTPLEHRVSVGDEVVLLGGQGSEHISTREFAKRAGCIEYEVTCGISKRVPRIYNGSTTDLQRESE